MPGMPTAPAVRTPALATARRRRKEAALANGRGGMLAGGDCLRENQKTPSAIAPMKMSDAMIPKNSRAWLPSIDLLPVGVRG